MATDTRTVHFSVDPALRAYAAYLEAQDRLFNPQEYDVFSAGYRARVAEEQAPRVRQVPAVRGAEGAR